MFDLFSVVQPFSFFLYVSLPQSPLSPFLLPVVAQLHEQLHQPLLRRDVIRAVARYKLHLKSKA
jgi:hypothetical protein